jgi:hypothetical protein
LTASYKIITGKYLEKKYHPSILFESHIPLKMYCAASPCGYFSLLSLSR